jgi:flagellin
MLSIRTNMASVNAQRNMNKATQALQGNFAKLSSGYRITKASDDAAGMGVSTNLRSQITSYKMAMRNAQDAVSVIQTTEAALNESASIITRLRELTVQAASDGLGTTERGYLAKEVDQLASELDRIANTTEFNGRNLLSNKPTLQFQVGIRNTDNDKINIQIDKATLNGLGLDAQAGASTATNEKIAKQGLVSAFNTFSDLMGNTSAADGYKRLISRLDTALNSISNRRATLGATANRLQSAQNTLAIAMESAQQANSRIRDVDVAEESSKLSANQVLVQAGVSMLAQANQAPQAALKLLG